MESGISEFFRQLPVGFIIMFCGSGILLVFAIVYIARARAQRLAASAAPLAAESAALTPMSEAEMSDLPELDVLASAEVIEAAPPRPAGTYSLNLTDGGETDVVEVLTILRDVADGGLIIRIGDQAYRNPPAVADADFKRRFHNTLRDLNGAQPPLVVESPPPAPAEAAKPDEQTAELPNNSSLNEPVPPMRRTSSFEPAPGDLPKFKMPDTPVKPKRGQRPVHEPIPEIDVAGSIEAFLQHKLSMTPQYASRSIHVRSALHGGVTIEVDGKFFETVDEVDDAAVRQFLSATIQEWQARQ